MKILRNLLAVVGLVSILLAIVVVCWWNGVFTSSSPADLGPKPVKNPPRTHIAHHALGEADEIVFQDENYDGFFGDGGGTFIVKLDQPLDYSADAWHPISQYPDEFESFAPMGDSVHVRNVFKSPGSLWCVIQLKRSGEHLSNLVVAFYDPQTRIVIERIFNT